MRCPSRYDVSTLCTRTRTDIDHPIAGGNEVHVMFDHHDGIASLDQCVQLQQQAVHVGRMQARRRFVQYVQGMAPLGTL